MDQDAVTKIKQRLAELPADVQAAIQSSELHTKIIGIGSKYQLHIDQVGELEDEVMLAMLGFSPLEGLGGRLTQTLGVTPQVGEQLAGDINTQVFGAIRESMKKFADAKTAASNPAPVPTQPAAVVVAPAKPAPSPTPDVPTKPPVAPDMHKADVVLTEKTVSLPPVATTPPTAPTPATPPIYKADPYREPIQ